MKKVLSIATYRRFAVALASVAIIVISGVFSYNLYFTSSAYVDVDVNPSVELALNRFDRVIGEYAYNHDGEAVLDAVNIRHRKYSDAIGILIDAIVQSGLAHEESLISITLQTEDRERESGMLSVIESTVRHHHGTAEIFTFPVDGYTRSVAHGQNLSPAKYLAIQALIEVDPTATVEGCRHRSLGEIKQMTEQHAGNHKEDHSTGSGNRDESSTNHDAHHGGGGGHGKGHGHD